MRKILITTLMLFAMGLVYALEVKDNNEPPVIIITKDNHLPPTTDNVPLSLRSDIEASYYNGALTIVFNADLGNADIVVSNLATGDIWSESVSGVGVATLLLSGDEGYYEILIYTDCGNYSGEFEI